MKNLFMLRTYKLTGSDKGNTEKELFYDSASKIWATYEELFRPERYSLNPTLWIRSNSDYRWVRVPDGEFEKFYLGGRRQVNITTENVCCTGDLFVDIDEGTIEAVWNLWIDPDSYFGTSIRDDDNAWVNFYTYWHFDGTVSAKFSVDREDGTADFDWELTKEEELFFLKKMEKYSMDMEHTSLAELFKAVMDYASIVEDSKVLIPEVTLRRAVENFVSVANPGEWNGFGECPENFISDYSCNYPTRAPEVNFTLSFKKSSCWNYVITIYRSAPGREDIESLPMDVPLGCGKDAVEKLLVDYFTTIPDVSTFLYKGTEYPCGPLSMDMLRRYRDSNDIVRGVVTVSLSDLINGDPEGVLDILSVRLTGNNLLMDTSYEVVGICEDDASSLRLLVSGDVSMILEGDINLALLKKDGIIQDVPGIKKWLIGKRYHVTEIQDVVIKGTVDESKDVYILMPTALEYREEFYE